MFTLLDSELAVITQGRDFGIIVGISLKTVVQCAVATKNLTIWGII